MQGNFLAFLVIPPPHASKLQCREISLYPVQGDFSAGKFQCNFSLLVCWVQSAGGERGEQLIFNLKAWCSTLNVNLVLVQEMTPKVSTPPGKTPTPPRKTPTPPRLNPTPPRLNPTPPRLNPTPLRTTPAGALTPAPASQQSEYQSCDDTALRVAPNRNVFATAQQWVASDWMEDESTFQPDYEDNISAGDQSDVLTWVGVCCCFDISF